MMDFSFTFNGKGYQAAARDFMAITGDMFYFITLEDPENQKRLMQPALVKKKLGGYGWPSSKLVIETEFMNAVALGLIRKIERSK